MSKGTTDEREKWLRSHTSPVARTETGTLTVELLLWLQSEPRSYADTLERWRSSCPRLTIWEDAVHDGLVRVQSGTVVVTAKGREAACSS
jgi:hypothetical protein